MGSLIGHKSIGEWLDRLFKGQKFPPTEFHARVLVILDRVFGGLHNSPMRRMSDGLVEVEPGAVFVRCPEMTNLATFDGSRMTKLVVLAHHFAIRVELCLEGRTLWLHFHERCRAEAGDMTRLFDRHPFLEEAAAEILKGLESYRVEAERASTDAQGSGVDAERAGGAGVPGESCAAVEAGATEQDGKNKKHVTYRGDRIDQVDGVHAAGDGPVDLRSEVTG